MKNIFNLTNLIILLLSILVITMFINPYGVIPNRISYVTETDSIPYIIHDTLEVMVETPYYVYVEIEKPVYVPTIQEVDTTEILKIYYSKNVLFDVLTLPNGMGTISLTDTISENKIKSRLFTTEIKEKIVIETVVETEKMKTKYFVGIDFGVNSQDFINHISTGIMVKTKKDKIYNFNLGVTNRTTDGINGVLAPYIGMGTYWRIGRD